MVEPPTVRTADVSLRTEFWVAAVPVLCAMHCLTVPVLLLFVPVLEVSSRTEILLLASSSMLATVLLAWGVQAHGQWRVWLPALAGLGCWVAAHQLGVSGAGKIGLETSGAVLLATGLLWSARLRHRYTCTTAGTLLGAGEDQCA
jgi:hypothetical protein